MSCGQRNCVLFIPKVKTTNYGNKYIFDLILFGSEDLEFSFSSKRNSMNSIMQFLGIH